ncbi:MAG: hypothetical protein Q8N03_03095 [Ignavibacteria bacterium]|nr:hypothetical protein [Ignavibacteria bacterium]
MLNKISNISSSTEGYTKSGNFSAVQRGALSGYSASNNVSDSIVYSSALIYLSRLKWQLKKMHQNKNGIIEISFTFDGFEFLTSVDVKNKQPLIFIDYSICNVQREKNDDQKLNLNLTTRTYDIKDIISINSLKLVQVPLLFERLYLLRIDKIFSNTDTDLLNRLLDGIYSELVKEFNEITNRMAIFIEKLTGETFVLPPVDEVFYNDEIVIKDIKRIDGSISERK